jgi:hypothetical protein
MARQSPQEVLLATAKPKRERICFPHPPTFFEFVVDPHTEEPEPEVISMQRLRVGRRLAALPELWRKVIDASAMFAASRHIRTCVNTTGRNRADPPAQSAA